MKTCIFVIVSIITAMSLEILEISVSVEEKFDMSFNLAGGILGIFLNIFGK